jgi:hypothetical protein
MIVLRGTSRIEGLASGGVSRKIVVGLEVGLVYVLLIGSGLLLQWRELVEKKQPIPFLVPGGAYIQHATSASAAIP